MNLKGGDYNSGYNSNVSQTSAKSGLTRVRSIENIEKNLNRKRRASIASISSQNSKNSDDALIKQIFEETKILNDFETLAQYINDTYENERDLYESIKTYISNKFISRKNSQNELIKFKQKYFNLLNILNYYNDLPPNIKAYFKRVKNNDFGGEYQYGGLKRKTRRRKTYRSKSLKKKKD